jgi:hypothetical protein
MENNNSDNRTPQFYNIDWDKVETLADMKMILSTFIPDVVLYDTPEDRVLYAKLEKFLVEDLDPPTIDFSEYDR